MMGVAPHQKARFGVRVAPNRTFLGVARQKLVCRMVSRRDGAHRLALG
jgi:hypothetical protein